MSVRISASSTSPRGLLARLRGNVRVVGLLVALALGFGRLPLLPLLLSAGALAGSEHKIELRGDAQRVEIVLHHVSQAARSSCHHHTSLERSLDIRSTEAGHGGDHVLRISVDQSPALEDPPLRPMDPPADDAILSSRPISASQADGCPSRRPTVHLRGFFPTPRQSRPGVVMRN